MDYVTYQLFFWTIGGVLALIGVVWRDHAERHNRVSAKFSNLEHLDAHISAIRTDIEWIKIMINKNIEK